jgi:hypothetical protein
VNREDIEQQLVDAGWDVDGSFAEHLALGSAHELSILVPHWAWQEEVPLYELYDVEKNLACWVWIIPTPSRAAMLLEDYGEPTPGEWDYTSSTQLRPEPRETMTQDPPAFRQLNPRYFWS